MCLKLYLPKDSLLSIDHGPDSHKLWGHVCDGEEDRERRSHTSGCSQNVWLCCMWQEGYELSTHMPFYEVLRFWQHLSQQLKVFWHFVLAGKSRSLKLMAGKNRISMSAKNRCKNEHVCRDKSDLPLPGLSAWTALSVYSAYFPKGTLTKKLSSSEFPAQCYLCSILPGKHCLRAHLHQRRIIFSVLFAAFQGCLG